MSIQPVSGVSGVTGPSSLAELSARKKDYDAAYLATAIACDATLAIAEMVDLVRQKSAGFVDYVWPKPGADKPQPKLSYVAGFAPWGWAVSTGVYIDDLDAQTWASTKRSLIAAGIVLLISLAVSPDAQGIGHGKVLIAAAERLARTRGYRELFAVSYSDDLFLSCGFSRSALSRFPEKIVRYQSLDQSEILVGEKHCFAKVLR